MRTPNNERLTPDIADTPEGRNASGPESRCAAPKGPERRCIVTGRNAPRDALVRLAISPDGVVLPDVHARAPGRGAWIGTSRGALENAISSGQLKAALARSFKGARIEIPAELPELVETALRRALLDRLGLELRAGHVVLGTAKIEEQARSGRAELLLHAADASEDGRKKLDQAWRVGQEIEGSGERGIVLPLDRAALSVALGRDNVVHLALTDRASAQRTRQSLARLLHYLAGQAPAVDTGDPASPGRHDKTERVKDVRAR